VIIRIQIKIKLYTRKAQLVVVKSQGLIRPILFNLYSQLKLKLKLKKLIYIAPSSPKIQRRLTKINYCVKCFKIGPVVFRL